MDEKIYSSGKIELLIPKLRCPDCEAVFVIDPCCNQYNDDNWVCQKCGTKIDKR